MCRKTRYDKKSEFFWTKQGHDVHCSPDRQIIALFSFDQRRMVPCATETDHVLVLPTSAGPCDTMQIFFVKVTRSKLASSGHWTSMVMSPCAVPCMDQKRNWLFCRRKERVPDPHLASGTCKHRLCSLPESPWFWLIRTRLCAYLVELVLSALLTYFLLLVIVKRMDLSMGFNLPLN